MVAACLEALTPYAKWRPEGSAKGNRIGKGTYEYLEANDWSERLDGGPPCYQNLEREATITAANGDKIFLEGTGVRACLFGEGEGDPIIDVVTGGTGRFDGATGLLMLVDFAVDGFDVTARWIGAIEVGR